MSKIVAILAVMGTAILLSFSAPAAPADAAVAKRHGVTSAEQVNVSAARRHYRRYYRRHYYRPYYYRPYYGYYRPYYYRPYYYRPYRPYYYRPYYYPPAPFYPFLPWW